LFGALPGNAASGHLGARRPKRVEENSLTAPNTR